MSGDVLIVLAGLITLAPGPYLVAILGDDGVAPRSSSVCVRRMVNVTATRLPAGVLNGRDMDVEFADLDGDGDLDIVFVSEDDRVNEYDLNDGTGMFTSAAERIPVEGTSNAVITADINGDTYPDLIIGNASARGTLSRIVVVIVIFPSWS